MRQCKKLMKTLIDGLVYQKLGTVLKMVFTAILLGCAREEPKVILEDVDLDRLKDSLSDCMTSDLDAYQKITQEMVSNDDFEGTVYDLSDSDAVEKWWYYIIRNNDLVNFFEPYNCTVECKHHLMIVKSVNDRVEVLEYDDVLVD